MASKQPKRPAATAARAPAAPPKRPAATPRPKPAHATPALTPEQRYRMIAEAAYLLAQRRGFAAGGEVQDWLDAEAQVDARLRED